MDRFIKTEFLIPKRLLDDYNRVCVRNNRLALAIMASFAVILELFNIWRVLFMSNSGLDTLNNRIYFAFYCFLFACAAIYLLLQYIWRRSEIKSRIVQTAIIIIALLWNSCLSAYNSLSAREAAGLVISIFMMGAAALFLMRPVIFIPSAVVCFLVYAGASFPYQTAGALIDVGIAICIACATNVVRTTDAVSKLKEKENADNMQEKLSRERKNFRLNQEQFFLIIGKTKDIMFRWDVENDDMVFSSNWNEIFGYPSHITGFLRWAAKERGLSEETTRLFKSWSEGLKDGIDYQEGEILISGENGRERWYQARILSQFDMEREAICGIGLLSDIMSQKETILRLEDVTQRDPLTNALNKTAIEAYVTSRISGFDDDETASLLIFDIDDFKSINDRYGHPCGDQALREFARCIKTVFPFSEGVGRIGGDEFILFAEDMDIETLIEKARRLLDYFSQVNYGGEYIKTSCSVGIAFARGRSKSFARLYSEADDALYTAKKSGKGSFHIYNEDKNP